MRTLLILTAVSVLFAASARAEPLTVLYFERPPYYYTSGGQPMGFLLQMADNLMREAGFEPLYLSVPPKRILSSIQDGEPACSVGWFQNPQREAFARFSDPIYHNRPLVVLFRWHARQQFAGLDSVSDLLSRRDLVWGTVDSFTYGQHVETLRAALHPRTMSASVSQGQLLGMLALGRFDYLLISPEELDALGQSGEIVAGDLALPEPGVDLDTVGSQTQRGDFGTLRLRDMPPGTPRRIMCSRSVPEEVIARLNKAIAETLNATP